ncbi:MULTISPECIES: MarR family winged helix-turn-helix transcriptional regulator [unclassified Arthrobacter]|uniref:MarR family winged helix-turn-helix transcriptional regulator n=1 Tax=unclassified Arthrobacter TaxID=235627 RepID=UPI001E5AEB02|nr:MULTISPECIES: MarR family winged helix-turn-helix transcriptional regulator [unclassified Arthrobacter]MCC9144612.1 MarR family winged helix-turn-helix transcriptional regulator [Arthrobacter sp. zg-Y919]MDK1275838.1 MarR family winged helix-turn-helix transcriptional regulator [Arthrobacter sp. zg.Y919]WIB02799.1 MarR family winged helix-turn-helix transcriptional regulator [Arthrobacter sp. zg-Y919]
MTYQESRKMQNEGDWEPVRLLSTAARLVRREVDNKLRAVGLTQERVTVLRVLLADGPMRRAELARRLRVTAQTLGTALVSMAGQGLVEEVPAETVGRSGRWVAISERGQKLLADAENLEQDDSTAGIGPELRAELTALIRGLEPGRPTRRAAPLFPSGRQQGVPPLTAGSEPPLPG